MNASLDLALVGNGQIGLLLDAARRHTAPESICPVREFAVAEGEESRGGARGIVAPDSDPARVFNTFAERLARWGEDFVVLAKTVVGGIHH